MIAIVQARTKDIVEAVRFGAFASPGSPLGLRNLVFFPLIMNNPG
jgi:hypothetical protein